MRLHCFIPSVVAAWVFYGSCASQAQGLEDVGFIFKEAYSQTLEWKYDKGFVRKPNALIVKERREAFDAYYYAQDYVGGPYRFRDTETIAEADPHTCVVTIRNQVDRESPDAAQAEQLKGVKSFIPRETIDQALRSSQTLVFYLNNVIVEDLTKSIEYKYGDIQHVFRLRGDQKVACMSRQGFQQNGNSEKWVEEGPTCENEIRLYVQKDNLRRFEAVLETAFRKLCRGAKREGKF